MLSRDISGYCSFPVADFYGCDFGLMLAHSCLELALLTCRSGVYTPVSASAGERGQQTRFQPSSWAESWELSLCSNLVHMEGSVPLFSFPHGSQVHTACCFVSKNGTSFTYFDQFSSCLMWKVKSGPSYQVSVRKGNPEFWLRRQQGNLCQKFHLGFISFKKGTEGRGALYIRLQTSLCENMVPVASRADVLRKANKNGQRIRVLDDIAGLLDYSAWSQLLPDFLLCEIHV